MKDEVTNTDEQPGSVEERLEQRSYELGERVKELSCLYDISQMLLETRSDELESVLERVVGRIPAGWQHPELAAARIRVGEVVCQTDGFAHTPWVQRQPFTVCEGVEGVIDGVVEVAYLDEPPERGGQVFIDEEAKLIEAIADRLSEAVRRAQAEERVRFQATLLEAVGEAVIATDLDGRVLYWNGRAEALFGWSEQEALGRNILEMNTPEDARERAEEILANVARGERWSGEFEVRRKDGTSFPAQVTSSPILDEAGRLVGVVGISRDLTERKAIEAQLRQAQKLEAVGRLAGGIAHDFNNMLTAIKGNTQLLREDVGGDEELIEHVGEIEQAARRAASLTRQLLAFSRQQVLQPEKLCLAEVVGAMKPMLERLIGEHIELDVRPQAGLGFVEADEGQLSQVVLNLVVNARDAMAGGGRVVVELDNVELDRPCEGVPVEVPEGRYVVLSVADEGHGIDDEVLNHIFDPFFTTKKDGSGLGLSTVYGIIKQSGGHVQVETELGEGTALHVYLPRAEVPPEATNPKPTKPPKRPPAAHAHTILVCEDEPVVRRLASRALSRQGYRVLVTKSGTEALDVLERADISIDVVVSDVVMPELGGLELAAIIDERWPQIRVLLISGYPSRDVLDADALEIATPFLPKPFGFDELCQKVAELLDVDG
ncbi:PAS domain S-box protein [Persicimonas caeni]|uniref:histidine kinase n=1 Tax=Persicimonas caeni TaxID=2292766 RepID=A0A4Y6PV51_PERCE|nr:PAS domain-containing sensor histidine kinase [Persicimonas caeni]QDG51989.1 PAS domain S-box protein [Persicimonas caeni]QED33210.1 PAS domain S-box protein [Persicimonas caeni]